MSTSGGHILGDTDILIIRRPSVECAFVFSSRELRTKDSKMFHKREGNMEARNDG